jgi:hypothetical protein
MGAIIMPTNEYMTPETEQVMAVLTQSCDELTRQALVRGITAKTKEWVQGDPELLDILQEGKKTLEECVRYVTEKAAFVIAKNINAMRAADIEQLPRAKIQGRAATMAGGAIDDEQVYKWAMEYYYDPDAKPRDFIKEAKDKEAAAKRKAEQDKSAAARKATADKKAKDKGKTVATSSAAPVASTGTSDGEGEKQTPTELPKELGNADSGEQMSMFGSAPDTAAA